MEKCEILIHRVHEEGKVLRAMEDTQIDKINNFITMWEYEMRGKYIDKLQANKIE